ncbi:MAG TPA: hypothetical protein VMW83_11545 [Spirochaetia bacterium]|nr:hypothetical protein [Spirochaetia bacterium]
MGREGVYRGGEGIVIRCGFIGLTEVEPEGLMLIREGFLQGGGAAAFYGEHGLPMAGITPFAFRPACVGGLAVTVGREPVKKLFRLSRSS